LSAVLGIVRSHRGTLTLQSAPGQGTCFTVLLPVATGPFPFEAQPVASASVARGAGLILVVDDEPGVCQTVQRALESNGYRVLQAADGLAAIEQVKQHPEIRAVVLDLTMPQMGGDVAAAHIRGLRPDLPILLSSGYAELEVPRSPVENWYSAFLRKPYTAQILNEQLGRVLNGRV
jgi:CheY-like chemotaxis protein